jgi:hypothetical protein
MPMEATILKVKEALQGAHMDLEQLQSNAAAELVNFRDTPNKWKVAGIDKTLEKQIRRLGEAESCVHEAVLYLDKITPEGT